MGGPVALIPLSAPARRCGTPPGVTEFAAVVLAGGQARRFGGADKVALEVEGSSLLQRTLSAVTVADPVVVVGQQRPVASSVRWTWEDPPGSGPLAGLRAGLAELSGQGRFAAVLAADHPYLSAATVARLLRAAEESEAAGAVLTDSAGERQWLVGVWRVERLRAAMPERVENVSLRDVLGPLEPVTVPASGAEASDVDTPEDWERLRG